MELQTKREGSKRETAYVIIHIGDTKYRITEERGGGIRINKFDFEDSSIKIQPCVSNEVIIT